MPNRIIKESICTSDSVDGLSWFEEVLFYRLIVSCDDYGRFDGRPAIIKNRLFPLKENLTIKAVSSAINTLARTGLVALYEFEGKPYLYLPTWNEHQNIRAKKSKYPSPEICVNTSEIICNQMKSDVRKCTRNPIQSESNPNPNTNTGKAPAEADADPLDRFDGELRKAVDDWLRYKTERREGYKPTGLKSLLTEIENRVKQHGENAVVDVIRLSMANNWRGIIWDRIKEPAGREKQQGELSEWEKEWLAEIRNR